MDGFGEQTQGDFRSAAAAGVGEDHVVAEGLEDSLGCEADVGLVVHREAVAEEGDGGGVGSSSRISCS